MGHYTETPAGRHYFFTLGYIRSTIITVGVVDGQPGKPNFGPYEAAPVNTREWQKGMCDCAEDCAWCCWTCCCTPCAAAQIAMRNDENCCVGCWLNTLGIQSVRTKMRIRYGLKGNVCQDCAMAYCCYCCTICQMHLEMKEIGI